MAGSALAQTPPRTFTMSVSPGSQDACFGDVIDMTVQLRSGDGYNFPVKVTLPNLPVGFFVLAAAPNPVVPGPNGNVNVRLTKNTGAQGEANIVLRGTGSNLYTAQTTALLDMRDVPGAPVPRLPENGFSTSTTPTLEWQGSQFAKSFRVQIATDSNFPANGITYEQFIAAQPDNTITVATPLAANQLYYWRVRGTNRCGDGIDSPIFSFVTDGMCAPLDLAIPDGGASGVTAEVLLPSGAALADVDVQVISDHPRAGELDVRVTHFGQEVQLLGASNCTAGGLAARFDDAASSAAGGVCNGSGNAIGGPLRPLQALTRFNGLPANGSWRVSVRDVAANAQIGRLRGVCVQTRADPAAGALFASGLE
jgi:hypothetical protein